MFKPMLPALTSWSGQLERKQVRFGCVVWATQITELICSYCCTQVLLDRIISLKDPFQIQNRYISYKVENCFWSELCFNFFGDICNWCFSEEDEASQNYHRQGKKSSKALLKTHFPTISHLFQPWLAIDCCCSLCWWPSRGWTQHTWRHLVRSLASGHPANGQQKGTTLYKNRHATRYLQENGKTSNLSSSFELLYCSHIWHILLSTMLNGMAEHTGWQMCIFHPRSQSPQDHDRNNRNTCWNDIS